MIKKIFSIFLVISTLLSLCACGNRPGQTAAGPEGTTQSVQPSEEPAAQVFPEEVRIGLESTLEAIYGVYPDSAGSSLRTMIAVGNLLDLSAITENCDTLKFERACHRWFAAHLRNQSSRSQFVESYSIVFDRAKSYVKDPGKYAEETESCGYPFREELSEEQVDRVLTNIAMAMAMEVSVNE